MGDRLGRARGWWAALRFVRRRYRATYGRTPRLLRSCQLLEKRLRLETAERVLPRVRRYVIDPGRDGAPPIRIIE